MNEKDKSYRCQILTALQLLRNICITNEDCCECPLRYDELDCMLATKEPRKWKLSDDDEEWRAFRE